MRIGFLGTGFMGLPMARHLLQAGHQVAAWNRTAARAAPLAALGGRLCASPAEAAAGAEIIIGMLVDGPTTDAALFTPDATGRAVLKTMAPGALVIIMSTIAINQAQHQAAQVAAAGGRYIDAPVSGGQKGAEEARLTIMAGGTAADIDAALPILKLLGRVTRVGGVGAGQLAKLANQMIVGITIGAVSEAMLLLKAGGADLAAAHQALMGGFADSPIWRLHGKRIIDGDFRPGGRVAVQLKDLRIAMEQAGTTGLDLPILGLLRDLYQQACDHGHGDLDHSALYLELAKRSIEHSSEF